MSLVSHDSILGPLGELTARLPINCLKLLFKPRDVLHVAFRELLEPKLVIALYSEFSCLLLKVLLEFLDGILGASVLALVVFDDCFKAAHFTL